MLQVGRAPRELWSRPRLTGRVVLLLLFISAPLCPGDEVADKVDALVQPLVGREIPGASVAIIGDGRIILNKSYGLANVQAKTRAEEHTNYRLASVTKQFTAMAIMIVKERGLLSYDDPLTRFFPDYPQTGEGITVRHLLGHTSGVIDYEDLIPARQKTPLRDRDVLELLKNQQGTYFTPGTRYRYSNTGYALLALIVEKASGCDFATFLAANIFAPLGMKTSVAFEEGVSTVDNRAYGYFRGEAGFDEADQSLTSAILGDGGIYTSLREYYLWDQALYGEKLVGRRILREAFVSGRLADGSSCGYGFGWRIDERRGVRVLHHDGRTCGFNNAVRRVPERRLTVVVFTNVAGKQAAKIADALLDWLLENRAQAGPGRDSGRPLPHRRSSVPSCRFAQVDLESAGSAEAETLPGFERSRHFDEQVKTYTFEPDVTVHINAPATERFDTARPTRLVLYALPNGNTIAQTIGRQRAPDVDWHFFIQHIGAQTRRLREIVTDENLVVAYLEAAGRSWPRWRREHAGSGEKIAALVDSIRAHFPADTTVDLSSHSGGGSFIFGYLNHVDEIPDWIGRIVFLDSNYAYSGKQQHGDKLIRWLQRGRRHCLGVVAYDDREIRVNGKLVVGPTGGTYRSTHRMLDRLRRSVDLEESATDSYARSRGLDGRIDVIILHNPDNAILHTVLVEKNGFIHTQTFASRHENKGGAFFGPHAYDQWIQPD